MTQRETLLTADDFFRLYSHQDDRYELVDGEVVEMAPVTRRHGRIASNIDGAFYVYSWQHGTGHSEVEVGYRVRSGPDTVRGPDVSFILIAHEEGDDEQDYRFVPGAPDIAVEVASRSETAASLERKVQEYLAAGSQRVWVVYPVSRRVMVYRPDGSTISYGGDDVITDEELLPGFSLPLADIFD